MTLGTSDNEWALLSAIVARGVNAWVQAKKIGLTKEQFSVPALGAAYEVLCEMFDAEGCVDKVQYRRDLHHRLGEYNAPESISAEVIVEHMWENRFVTGSAAMHARRIRDRAMMTTAGRCVAEMADRAADWDGTPQQFIAETQRRLVGIGVAGQEVRGVKLSDQMDNFERELWLEYESPYSLRGLSTGYSQIDDMTLGLCPGHVWILGAESGGGKTALAGNIALNVGRQGKDVVIFSLEMNWEELARRFAFAEARVQSKRYRKKQLTDMEKAAIHQALQRIRQMNVWIYDSSSLSLNEMVAICQEAKYTGNLGFVILDYAQLLDAGDLLKHNDNREREVALIAKTLKRIASDLQVPVMGLSQLNEDGQVRESKALKHYCHVLAKLRHVTENADADFMSGEALNYELILEKVRDGERGKVSMLFHARFTRFDEIDDNHGDPDR